MIRRIERVHRFLRPAAALFALGLASGAALAFDAPPALPAAAPLAGSTTASPAAPPAVPPAVPATALPAVPEIAGPTRHRLRGEPERSYRLYRPASLGRLSPVPLVIVLHGGFGSGAQAERSYGWDALAEQQGFVVAYPDGINHSWNAGGICCGPALHHAVDDLGYLTRLIGIVSVAENIDPRRIYLAGISNGAAMAYRYACQGSYPIAAIGAVAGSFSFACPRPQPVSLMAIHGLNDQHVPMAGGQGGKGVTHGAWVPVDQTVQAFRSADSCEAPVLHQDGPLQTAQARCAQGREVQLITIAGAGHQWPGASPKTGWLERLLGADPPSTALDATAALWRFFMGHPAPLLNAGVSGVSSGAQGTSGAH
jgi:polyhydroxybutyrate depolymerase